MAEKMIECPRCHVERPEEDYYRQGGQIRKPCKPCLKIERRRIYERAGGSAVSHAQVLRDKYGMTPEDYARMLAEQDGLCAICSQPETATTKGVVRRLSVDHDHRTGVVRRLLCQRCNSVVRAVEGWPELLAEVRAYLDAHAARGLPDYR